jgi:hypothetical protein
MKNTMRRLMIACLALLLVVTSASNPWPQRNAEAQTTESDSKKVEIDVPVRGTFLRAIDMWPYKGPGTYVYDEDLEMNIETSGLYRVERPAIVDLQAKGFTENDKVVIRYTADVDGTGAWGPPIPSYLFTDGQAQVLALFSATPDLEPIGELRRVPGAIDFGQDFKTDHTYWDEDCESVANTAATKGITIDRGGETDIPEDFLINPYNGMKLQIPKGAKYLFLCFNDTYIADVTGWITVTIERDNTSVEDGYGHKLGGVEVTLLAPSEGGPTTVAVTLTDDEGGYSFSDINDGDYQIEVALEYHKEVGDTPIFSVNYDTGPAVSAQTDTFHVTGGTVARDINFADADLIPVSGIPQDRLDDLAVMYYHTKQVVDFERTELGVTPDLTLPIEVRAYRQGTTEVFYSGGDISIGDAVSGYNDPDRPMNRDWHEMFHELMDDTVGIPSLQTGDTNHGGFANHCTGDSWVEGWAEFWPCALKRSLGEADWRVYKWAGGNSNLEYVWRVWDDEEFAVASLLVDLADPVDPADGDYISLTNSQLWAIIGSQSLADMSGVYAALVAAKVGQLDIDTDNTNDLDELFIAHGFFADDGNKLYDGETVGLGGKPGRTDKPAIPGASIRVLVEDSQGNPVSDGTLMVDVTYPSPMDIYNYSYEVSLSGSDSQVGFYVAPQGDDALVTMRVEDTSSALSDELVVSNSVYWEKVEESTTGYAAEHTFVIGAEGKTTEMGATASTTSGGVPVWIWPIVGVAVIAAGAGVFFLLLRKRAKPS